MREFRRKFFATRFDYVSPRLTFRSAGATPREPTVATNRSYALKNMTHEESDVTREDGRTRPTLVFVYNAESGIFNTLSDVAHKLLSPQTYACNLCALTHSTFGMRNEWKDFLRSLDAPLEFLHADELRSRYGMTGLALPAILRKRGASLEELVDAVAVNSCRTLDELKRVITDRL
jgi:hypothetical protein